MIDFAQICEITMLCVFGASWPFNIAKSLRSQTAKGKSVIFEILVILGYCAGLCGKIWDYTQTGILAYSTWFYIADIPMVCIDVGLYVRNTKLDRLRETNLACAAKASAIGPKAYPNGGDTICEHAEIEDLNARIRIVSH